MENILNGAGQDPVELGVWIMRGSREKCYFIVCLYINLILQLIEASSTQHHNLTEYTNVIIGRFTFIACIALRLDYDGSDSILPHIYLTL